MLIAYLHREEPAKIAGGYCFRFGDGEVHPFALVERRDEVIPCQLLRGALCGPYSRTQSPISGAEYALGHLKYCRPRQESIAPANCVEHWCRCPHRYRPRSECSAGLLTVFRRAQIVAEKRDHVVLKAIGYSARMSAFINFKAVLYAVIVQNIV